MTQLEISTKTLKRFLHQMTRSNGFRSDDATHDQKTVMSKEGMRANRNITLVSHGYLFKESHTYPLYRHVFISAPRDSINAVFTANIPLSAQSATLHLLQQAISGW